MRPGVSLGHVDSSNPLCEIFVFSESKKKKGGTVKQ